MLQSQRKFWGKRPGFDTGDLIHFGVNVGFAVTLFVMVRYWNLPHLAAVLVLISKGRIFAVQSRFWVPNLKANLVDIVVGLSTVMLMYQADSQALALFWAMLFSFWLIFVKPKTSDLYVGMQALWSQFIGLLTVFSTFSLLEFAPIGILLVWLISWSSARHFLGNYEEPHYKILSLIWALSTTQIAWVGFHWINYYQFFGVNISTTVLFVTIIAGTCGALYHAYHQQKLTKNKVLENVFFGLALIAVLMATSPWVSQL